jgi:hypothetical protein
MRPDRRDFIAGSNERNIMSADVGSNPAVAGKARRARRSKVGVDAEAASAPVERLAGEGALLMASTSTSATTAARTMLAHPPEEPQDHETED